MALNHAKMDPACDRRCKELMQLLGIREAEARDGTLSGRLKIIGKLKAARRVEIARGRAGSWLYDVNRHLNLCATLRQEYDALVQPEASSHPVCRTRSSELASDKLY